MRSASAQRFWMGTAISSIVVLIICAVFFLIWNEKGDGAGFPTDIAHLLRMSAIQAGLSTTLSLGIGVILAWALNRVRFIGRALLISLHSAALVTPGIVVAVGLISVWGRAGWINTFLSQFGFHTGSIFGFQGILYAHVILNATFAAAVLLAQLNALSITRIKVGQNLRLNSWQRFRVLDWPALAPALPGLGAIIFLLTFTSFPIVLTLGGGPANQTFEVAIYAAVRLDFDLQAAVVLALAQLGLCALLVIPASIFSLSMPAAGKDSTHYWPEPMHMRILQFAIITLSSLGLGIPLVAILLDGLSIGPVLVQAAFWNAALTSLLIGTCSALLALSLGIFMAMARVATRSRIPRMLIAAPSYIYLAIPGVTLALGFFLGARAMGLAPGFAAPFVLIIANALLALPYALATLVPAFEANDMQYGRLCKSLSLSSWTRFAWIEWPTMGREIGLIFSMSFCFSLGDLSVIALFGTESFSTLPWLMTRALGAYRTNDAAAIAAILLVASAAIFLTVPRIIERIARART